MTTEWNMVFAVAAGGGIGAAFRYIIASVVQQGTGDVFPYGTLVVNVLGSLLLGFILQIAEMKTGPGPWMKLFLTVGLCGGFTTFSTFSLESIRLLRRAGDHGESGSAAAASVGEMTDAGSAVLFGGAISSLR